MRRSSGSFRNSGAYTSPGTPEYGDNNVGGELPKTWSSERVPLPMNTSSSSRRYINSTALMPFNSGRALPSKWDDAERWITSPISGYGAFKASVPAQPQRRVKSKSGPLGPTGHVYLSNYSPTMAEGGVRMRNFMANSPLTTGVLASDGLSVHYDAGKSNDSSYGENNMTRSTSVPSETSGPSSQDDKFEGRKEEEEEEDGEVSRVVSRRDMATQMSPEGSTHSSSRGGRLSFSIFPSSIPTAVRNIEGNDTVKDEIRDVQVDKGTTSTTKKQSKKQRLRKTKKHSTNVEELPAAWNVAEASKNTSKLQREEAKITAWENLQNAKAEAAIRKLEMKLEKKRSKSMDKITNKLRAAQMKARAKRDSLSDQSPRTSQRRSISCCVRVKICSLKGCFSRHRN